MHVGGTDSFDVFQGHTDLVVGGCSSGACRCDLIDGSWNRCFSLLERLQLQSFGFDRRGGFFLVEFFAIIHDDGGAKSGENDFFDAFLSVQSQTGSTGDTSSTTTDENGVGGLGGCFRAAFWSGFLFGGGRFIGGAVLCV